MSDTLVITYGGRIEERATDYFVSSGVATTVNDQAWFWTPEWQTRFELAVSELDSGDFVEFENGDDFLASLNDL